MFARCIRCGDTAATDSLYCESCFEVALNATMTEVRPVNGLHTPRFDPEPMSPWVKNALAGRLPAKAVWTK